MEETRHTAMALRRKLDEKQRNQDSFIIATSQNPIVGRTDAEAHQKYMELAVLNRYQRIAPPLFLGSAESVADEIQEWYEQGIMDMLIIKQDHPYGLRDFIELVVPILQERGIFHTDYEETTLRGNLELPKPAFRNF